MPLIYVEKLKIFHDTFIKYAWNYIERQKAMENGQEVPAMTTPFKDNLLLLRILPIVKDTIDVVTWLNDIWNGHLYHTTSVSMIRIFSSSDRVVKQTLSKAIQEIAIHVEAKLNKFDDPQTIGTLATAAVIKLITSLRNSKLDNIKEYQSNDIVGAVLKQNSLFTNDRFLIQGANTNSNNYHYISEIEIRNYINNKKIANVEKGVTPITIEFDSSMDMVSITSSISSATAFILCEYIRNKNKLSMDKQIVIVQEDEQDKTLFPIYTIIGSPMFDTEIDSLRIDNLEDIAKNNQEEFENQEVTLIKHEMILDEHKKLFQQLKQDMQKQPDGQVYLQPLPEYSQSDYHNKHKTKHTKTVYQKANKFLKNFVKNIEEEIDASTKSKKHKKDKFKEKNDNKNNEYKSELDDTKSQLHKANEDLNIYKMKFEQFKKYMCESGASDCSLTNGELTPNPDYDL